MARTVRSLQKSGIRAKQGKVGKRTQYWTRARVLRKLQVSLKDFRRLCILKGIYPREPPKGKDKSKVYYHAKDIKYLSHEKLIEQLRDLKVFMKRRSRLIGRHEKEDIESMSQPVLKLDHLVRERYPSISDALRDLDDPLTLLNLFNTLRVRVHKTFTEKDAEMTARLVNEWREFVIRTAALRKVFVSIKGYYFQANVKGQLVTWLVPHQAMQKTPQTVDYSVMTTFLRFYETMLRCVNFKLFKELGVAYPPQIPTEEEASKKMLDIKDSENTNTQSNKKKAIGAAPGSVSISAGVIKSAMKIQKMERDLAQQGVNAAAALNDNNNDDDSDNEDDGNEDGQNGQEEDTAAFQQLDPSMQLTDLDAEAVTKTFANCVVLVGRETAFEQISLVIRCGGGIALHETAVPVEYLSSNKITHQVVDRPRISGQKVMGRGYVQPQWVFDSFNMRSALPLAPYAPGQSLPPHLSPFVDDAKESYVPDQRNQLRAWVGLPPLKQSVLQKIQLSEEQQRAQAEARDEDEYQSGLVSEQKKGGKKAKAQAAAATTTTAASKKAQAGKKVAPSPAGSDDDDADNDDDDIELDMGMGMADSEDEYDNDDDDENEIDVEDVSDADFDEENFLNSDDDDDDEEEMDDEEKKIAAKPKPVARPRENNRSETDLSRIVMAKKDKRLHSRMMYGKGRESEQAKILATKRDAAAQGIENPTLPKRNFRATRQR